MSIVDFSSLRHQFLEFIADVLSHRDSIVYQKNTSESISIVAKNINSSLKQFIKTVQDNNIGNMEIDNIAYAMASFADEIYLNIPWEGKAYWEANMLEFEFFKTQSAGDDLFTKIDDVLDSKNHLFVHTAEIYLKVLALGFLGKYRPMNDEGNDFLEINLYRKKLIDFIEKYEKIPSFENRIFQKEYTFTIPAAHRILLPDASILSYMSAFFVFMFLIITSAIWMLETRDLKSLLNDISHMVLKND